MESNMNKIKLIIITFFAVVSMASFVSSGAVLADAADNVKVGTNSIGGNDEVSIYSRIKTIVNILLTLLGAVAVVMIVIGGIRYTTSNGDSSAIKGAKDTILYAAIGVVVAIMAYAIVNFIIDQF
jgi:hypothetical protein